MRVSNDKHSIFTNMLLVTATLTLVALMPAWRWVWSPEPAPVTYPITAEAFWTHLESMIATSFTGEIIDNIPVVHPPPGDVYLAAQRYSFFPVLELEIGHTYTLHIATTDTFHGFTFPLAEADLLLVPGYASLVNLTPVSVGRYSLQCSEYCGLEHSRMKGWVRVIR